VRALTDDLARCAWADAQLAEALFVVARESGLHPTRPPEPGAARAGGRSSDLDESVTAAARAAGVAVEAVEVTYAEVEDLVRRAAPALIRIAGSGEPRTFALLQGGRRGIVLLDPDLRRRKVQASDLRDAMRSELEARVSDDVERLLDAAGVSGTERPRVRQALLAERLSAAPISGCWILDLPVGTSFSRIVARAGVRARIVALIAAHMAQQAILLMSWWVLGRGVLRGSVDVAWLLAWALLLLTYVPLRAIEVWSAGIVMTRVGQAFKRRLIAGALRLEPDEIRHEGVGRLLGRVLNAESLRFFALNGTHLGVITVSEILIALPVVAQGVGGWPHAAVLAGWTGVALALSWSYMRVRDAWTTTRLGMTHELVEKMVGHRTRLAQQAVEDWHAAEDGDLESYAGLSAKLDRRLAMLRVLIPRGWLVVSLLAIGVPFISGTAPVATLAISVGITLTVYWSFWKMVRGLAELAEARIAWRQVAPIFHAAARPLSGAGVQVAVTTSDTEGAILEAHDLAYRYVGRTDTSVSAASVRIHRGDRLLLEGSSGGGKSTLASLLAGLRVPESGLLLLQGLDRHTLGEESWRRRVVAAPQFQDNHVLTETLAFNVLMGRQWPPEASDLEEAEVLCRELGLGDLIDRMPAGLLQMVGESGWQLSHGERSRVYVARALLQRAPLVILDESFAALDPENLRQSLQAAMARADALLVIAHP
jgi:ATP-binding cassette subfamily B protein